MSALDDLSGQDDALRQYKGILFFDDEAAARGGNAQGLAKEIAGFTRDHAGEIPDTGPKPFTRAHPRPMPEKTGDFDKHPLISTFVHTLYLSRRSDCTPLSGWEYSRAAVVGLNPSLVVQAIDRKATRVECYRRSPCEQLWLLICAGADVQVPSDSAGTVDLARNGLDSVELCESVRRSGFDQVIFWEKWGWYKSLCRRDDTA
ncbi:MAG TPA: hypothetical protein VNA25_05170 [Phycisphaerae bacterium]|nr:hypothetical protein [Phycisphaerae bacterium]